MGKRVWLRDPFGRFPTIQVGAVLLGVRQDLRQKGKVQPYLELGGGAYYVLERDEIPPATGNVAVTYRKVVFGAMGGLGVRFLVGDRLSMGVMTRGHWIDPERWPFGYSYFEWGGFLGFRFGS